MEDPTSAPTPALGSRPPKRNTEENEEELKKRVKLVASLINMIYEDPSEEDWEKVLVELWDVAKVQAGRKKEMDFLKPFEKKQKRQALS